MDTPQPGDILLVHRLDPFALAIQATQLLAGYPWADARVNHWQVVVAVGPDNLVDIVEASLSGVRRRRILLHGKVDFVRPHYADLDAALAWVHGWIGKPYGFLDIPALLLTTMDFRPRRVRRVLTRPSTIVCSQLGAGAAWAGGDPRVSEASWPYFVPAMCGVFA